MGNFRGLRRYVGVAFEQIKPEKMGNSPLEP